MKQRLINIYVLISAITAITTTFLEVQPAFLFIEFLAPNPGDRYSLVFVLLMTVLTLLVPLLVLLIIMRLFGSSSSETINPDRTGIFITRQKSFASALVGIPVYINDKKVGIVDNGKTVFFDAPSRTCTIQAGKGKQASKKMNAAIPEGEQLTFDLWINKEGLFPKFELKRDTAEL